MTTKVKVMARLDELNARMDAPRLDPFSRRYSTELYAPQGYVWSNGQVHSLVVTDADDMKQLWQWVWAEIGKEHVIPCTDPDCDICHPVEEGEEG